MRPRQEFTVLESTVQDKHVLAHLPFTEKVVQSQVSPQCEWWRPPKNLGTRAEGACQGINQVSLQKESLRNKNFVKGKLWHKETSGYGHIVRGRAEESQLPSLVGFYQNERDKEPA